MYLNMSVLSFMAPEFWVILRGLQLLLRIFLKMEEIIVDLYAVIRNNTERALVNFAQFSPVVTFCKVIM